MRWSRPRRGSSSHGCGPGHGGAGDVREARAGVAGEAPHRRGWTKGLRRPWGGDGKAECRRDHVGLSREHDRAEGGWARATPGEVPEGERPERSDVGNAEGKAKWTLLGDSQSAHRAAFPMGQRVCAGDAAEGAALKEELEFKTAADERGLLEVLGLSGRFAEAEAAAIRGELGVACEALEDVAAVAANRMPVVSDVLLMRAAGYATRKGTNDRRQASCTSRVARSAAERGDDASESAAFRASWELPKEEEPWRSFAATARAVWPTCRRKRFQSWSRRSSAHWRRRTRGRGRVG